MSVQSSHFLERLKASRPGYRLLDIEPAAVPMFIVRADILLIEKRPLGPLEEFVLKAINLGSVTIKEIAGVLGLDPQRVVETAVSLQQADCIYQVVVGDQRELRLSTQGKRVLDNELSEAPSTAQVRIGFDRLAWSVTKAAQGHLLRPKDVREAGRLELKPRIKRRVGVADLDVDQIEKVVRSVQARENPPTVVAVDRVARIDRFYMEVDLAIFESLAGGDPQIAVLVDDRPSQVHETTIERLGGLSFIGGQLDAPSTDPTTALVADYGAAAADLKLEVSDQQTAPPVAGLEAEEAPQQTQSLTSVGDASPESTTSRVQFIDTYEHRVYLDRALTESRERLVIISPWISASVVTPGFLERLLGLIRRGVRVHIGYGLDQRPGDRNPSEADQRAERALEKMAERHPNFDFVRLGNTHSKQLLFDDVHVSGSFNWLSFRGSQKRKYRHEESTVIRVKSKVDEKYLDLLQRLRSVDH